MSTSGPKEEATKTKVSMAPEAQQSTAADWAAETEQRLLDAALLLAPQTGWNRTLIVRAGREIGLSLGETELLVPNGARDLAALLSRRHDALAMQALDGVDPKSLKIRERISVAVSARISAAIADEAAVRRLCGYLAWPANLPLALRLVWESADGIWRWAGDVATDENHYSKRAILAGILITTLAVRMQSGLEAEAEYLAASIERVMAFEKWKAKFHPAEQARDIARALGRIRYGRG
jgi:ubiquinone biosynthesis protein COQ9